MAPSNREINEFRRRFGTDAARPVSFVCECADPECLRAVLLTPAEHDALVSSAAPSVLYAAHVPPTSATRR